MQGKLLVVILILTVFNTVSAIPKPRIINGVQVPVGALPWQVILKKNPSDDVLCGGSVIAANWVLTAGHCTYQLKSIFLIFGTNNLKTYSVSMISTQFYLHPDYDPLTLNNDVSLIKLPSLLTFSDAIKPIQLVPQSDENESFVGTTALIAGHGYTDDLDLEQSDPLLAALVVIIDNKSCAPTYSEGVVIQSTMCAKGRSGNQSICSGDSGGPLVTMDSDDTFIQIGINSFVVEDSCTEGYPSGYARLTSFLSFIQSTMDSN
ncbi:collagenase-like [Episyrphus balteatus]|uniref:collagenase-like n=1 Tax=Episyrphus balteatus TaxID=286459 RepID=UPI002485D4E0|nr:collagenase-like [Episyrphus balteatus]